MTDTPRLVPLRWTEGRFSSIYGTVGKVTRSVASVNWSIERNDPTPWVVRVELPGMESQRRKAATKDEAKAIAAAMVNKWLRDALVPSSQESADSVAPTDAAASPPKGGSVPIDQGTTGRKRL